MPHAPRHSGGFSQGQSVIGGFTPSSTPAQNTGPFGSFFGASSDPIPGGTTQPASGNQFAQYQQAADTMQQAGIGSLSGATTDTQQGQAAAAIQNAFQQSQGTGSQGTGSQDTGDEGDDGEGLDDIIFKVLTGPEINRLDPFQMRRVKSILDNYIKLGETNPLKLRALMTGNIVGGIFGKDQSFSDMEGNIVDEEDIVFKDGQMFTKDGKPIRRTKEGTIDLLKEEIGSEGIQSLKMFNPEMYYPFMGMPATSGSLVDLAKIPVTEEMQGTNPELAQMIFNARMELDRMGKNPMTGESQGGGGGQGIVAAAPSQPIGIVPRPGPIVPDPTDPTDPVIPMPIMTPATGTPFSSNYFSNLPQFNFSQYAQRGVPSLINYNDILRRFYG